MPSKVLPRLVALKHADSILPRVKKLIDSLPKKSKVGIEGGNPQDYANLPLTVKHFLAPNIFNQISNYAKQRGHTVVWLERRNSAATSRERRDIARLEPLLQIMESTPEDSPERLRAALKRLEIYDRLNAHPLTSYWRSTIMGKRIRRETWKPTDLVLTGSAHAVNLSQIFDHPVHAWIGDYASEEARKREIAEVTRGQEHLTRQLEVARRLNKRINRFTKPFKKLARRLRGFVSV